MPSGTGFKRVAKLNPSKETPALANAKIGIIPKATYGERLCLILIIRTFIIFNAVRNCKSINITPAIVAWTPD